nr:cation channel sperm-associated protein subunit delta isoform X6 [Odocoileus virginianus texanus]
MLALMLVAATTSWLCPLVTAQPLCRTRTLRTGKVFPVKEKIQGDRLYFSSGKTHLIKHPCNKNLALYLGRQIFLTKDNFESSLIPFSIPSSMQVGTPEVTSAHFAGSVLLLVVNQKVYVYDYEANFWTASTGIEHPVSHVSGDNCCYSGNSFCMIRYLRPTSISQTPEDTDFRSTPRKDVYVQCDENELAVLTRENNLYYGSLGIQSSSLIKFADQNIWSQEAVLMFTDVGMLEILTPLPDMIFPAFDFQKCLLNIQALLMDPQLQAGICKVELLQGEFENKMYTIDMNSQLELTALMIPRPGTLPVPLVMVSNPHSLGLQAVIYEDGYTYNGDTKHRLNISLKQQHHWGRADPNFTSSIKRPTISTITLDIANKEISCVDLKPLTALISVGCDLEKKIVIQNELSACHHGVLDPVALQDNYSYIIEREAYDPNFQGQQAEEDLEVYYPYEKLGCPLLAYYDTPWKPVVELWREGKFQEVVEAEYVLLEMNGLFTYTYSLTAGTAGCSAQPQNWTTITEMAGDTASFSWDRENYMSCHDPDYHEPLRWPDVPYQILGGPTENKVVFDQRNGIYIFFISIVDPSYSYCHLETTFSVYVYGAFPLSIFPPITIVLLTVATLLSVWLAYMIPQLLHMEQGLEVSGFWARLYQRCRSSCACLWGRC